MIAEFEQRLANVLGGRLPAPFTGRVAVAPGFSAGNQPRLLIGVRSTEPIAPDLGSQRPEAAPGADDPRRVLRLRCLVGLECFAGGNGGRAQQVQALDAALYALDAPDLRNGSALAASGDPGFLIQEMRLLGSTAPLDPGGAEEPVGLTLAAAGWFWSVGVVGEAGEPIQEVRLRGGLLPISLRPEDPPLVAGGPEIDLTLRFGPLGLLRLADPPLPPQTFGRIGASLIGASGGLGAGTLSGGEAGAAGIRLYPLTDGQATLTYEPPDEATVDTLVVALDDGEGGLGLELGRVALKVREP